MRGIVKLTKSSSTDPQDTGLKPGANPPGWASETAVSLNLTIPFTGRPASASRRNPMICASLNRFFTSDLPSREIEL